MPLANPWPCWPCWRERESCKNFNTHLPEALILFDCLGRRGVKELSGDGCCFYVKIQCYAIEWNAKYTWLSKIRCVNMEISACWLPGSGLGSDFPSVGGYSASAGSQPPEQKARWSQTCRLSLSVSLVPLQWWGRHWGRWRCYWTEHWIEQITHLGTEKNIMKIFLIPLHWFVIFPFLFLPNFKSSYSLFPSSSVLIFSVNFPFCSSLDGWYFFSLSLSQWPPDQNRGLIAQKALILLESLCVSKLVIPTLKKKNQGLQDLHVGSGITLKTLFELQLNNYIDSWLSIVEN